MASIVNLPGPVSTNLGLLGGVVAEGARDYAQKRRADELEARRRAERLADVENDRAYARTEGDRIYGRGRDDKLTDEQRARDNRLTDTAAMNDLQWKEFLVKAGYLSRDAMKDETAVAVANEMAADDGLTQLQAGRSDITFKQTQRTNAVKALNKIAGERERLMQQYVALNDTLAAPAPVIDEKKVIAITVARLSQDGKVPDVKAIAKAAPAIREEMQMAIFMQEKAEKDRATVQRAALANQIQALTTRADAITRTTGAMESQFEFEPAEQPVAQPKGPAGKTVSFMEAMNEKFVPQTKTISPEIQKKHADYTKSRLNEPDSPTELAPLLSLKGYAQRVKKNMSEGPALTDVAMAPVRLLDTVGQYGEAGMRGLYSGDYTVPQGEGVLEGLTKSFGESAGQSMADASLAHAYREVEKENAILKNAPLSLQAKLIRQRLGMPEPMQPPLQSAPQQNLTWPEVRY
jgi:hypothetical protein